MRKNPGRKQRRALEKSVHHNCFTKKYPSCFNRFTSFENAGMSFGVFLMHEIGVVLPRPRATKTALKRWVEKLLRKVK